jgi:hypothetical protein
MVKSKHMLSSVRSDAECDNGTEFGEAFSVDEDGDDSKILQATRAKLFKTCGS